MPGEPEQISRKDTAVAALETALRAFAVETDLYIPRKPELAEFLFERAVLPILADWDSRQPARMIVSTEKFAEMVERFGDPATWEQMYCLDLAEHNIHIWEWQPPFDEEKHLWPVPVKVRCPGRDGI